MKKNISQYLQLIITALAFSLLLFSVSPTYAQCPTPTGVIITGNGGCPGTSATLGVVTSVAGTYYQVKLNGSNFGNPVYAASQQTPFWLTTTTAPGTYTVVASKSGCSNVQMSGSATFSYQANPVGGLTLNGSPSICQGSSVSISATTGFASYQWKRNGVNIPGATSSEYAATLEGAHSVVVTNNCGGSSTWSGIPAIQVSPTVSIPSQPSGTTARCQAGGTDSYGTSADGATGFSWSLSPSSAGSVSSGSSSTCTINWNPAFSGQATISVSAYGCNGPSASSSTAVTVYPVISPGSIGPVSININYNTSPGLLSGAAASGGNGSYSYQWQTSADNSNWISVSGATSASYSPGNLTSTTYFRRIVSSNCGDAITNTASVSVYPQLISGTISQPSVSINYNTTSGSITSGSPSGGDGTYAFQWQQSPDNSSWSNIGNTTLTFPGAVLTSSTWYRLITVSNGVSVTSNAYLVTVYPPLSAGSISPANLTINYNTSPGNIAGTTATGGNGTYAYQWERSADNANWSEISAALSGNLDPGSLTASTYYRRRTTSNGVNAYTNTSFISVYPQLIAGNASPSSQNINFNTSPGVISASSPSGGNSSYSFQWESSADNTSWSSINGAVSISYSPGSLTGSVYYRLKISSNGVIVYTNSSQVSVYPQLNAGVLSPASVTINYNSSPGVISASSPSGGNSVYAIQWEKSADNSNWSVIDGVVSGNYNPGNLITSTYYRRKVISNGVSVYSNTSFVNVYAQLSAGTISPSSLSINYNTSPGVISGTIPSGGNGTYIFQWERSPDNNNWSAIQGATSANLNPGNITTSAYFRRKVTSNGITAYSNSSAISVNQLLTAGTISPEALTIDYGTSAGTISATLPTGGNGTYSYQWQRSADNISWSPIAGAVSANYVTDNLTSATYFRRAVTSNGITVYSNVSAITVTSINCQTLPASLPSDQNYIITYVPRKEGIVRESQLNGTSNCDVEQTVNYFDGLNRLIQTVQVKASPSGEDIVLPVEYDQYGREVKKYLPYAADNGTGTFKPTAIADDLSFYSNAGGQGSSGIAQTNFPYTPISYETSPLSRLLQQGAPGAAWQLESTPGATDAGHVIKSDYDTNSGTEVKQWEVSGTSASTSGNYQAGQLYKTNTTDENGNNAIDYRDKDGRVVMKSVQTGSNTYASTYYLYDDFGNLCFVLPPGVTVSSFNFNSAEFNNLMYAYRYDSKKRLVAKKLPGKDFQRMVYNKLDQLVLSQDGVQLPLQKWTFNKYDALGRVIMTGEIDDSRDRIALTQVLDAEAVLWEEPNGNSSTHGYTNDHFPTVWSKVYTVNYYDNYDFPGIPYAASDNKVVDAGRTKGLFTGSKVLDLESGTMLWRVNYYDKESRNRQSFAQNHLGGYDVIVNDYYFSGELKKSDRNHFSTTISPLSIVTEYKYDHAGRKKEVWQNTAGTGNVILSRMEYNEVGQLRQKKLHSEDQTNFIETINYSYNPRGWLQAITTPSGHFSEQLYYETAPLSGVFKNYNGNITEAWYNSPTVGDKRFSYVYDKLNRLTASKYYSGTAYTGQMDETITYDQRGNISKLIRGDSGDLGYYYKGTFDYTYQNGNQLKTVKYNGNAYRTYTYDLNGNMTFDNWLTLTYNHLNLPQTASRSGNINTYRYTAAGNKLRMSSTLDGTRDYIGGIEYRNNTVDFIVTEEGRYIYSSGQYQYNLTDHLGNVRAMIVKQNATAATVEQENEYYAFGLSVTRKNISPENRYLYNGKEVQPGIGLGMYDYGARMYNAVLGRWYSVDPMADIYFSESPYVYAGNSPIKFVDAGGLFRIDALFAEMYPTLTKMLKYYSPMLKYNDAVRNAFKEVTDMTDAEFDQMITYGKGPWITPTRPELANWTNQNDPAYSEDSGYDGVRYPNNLFIEKNILVSLENAFKSKNADELGFNMFMASIAVMHEAAHYGVFKKKGASEAEKMESANEQGARWEGLAYRQFSYTNKTSNGGLSRDDVREYYHTSLTTASSIGMTLSPRIWYNNMVFKQTPKPAPKPVLPERDKPIHR